MLCIIAECGVGAKGRGEGWSGGGEDGGGQSNCNTVNPVTGPEV